MKRLKEADTNRKIVETYLKRKVIKESIIEFNKKYFAKVHNNLIHKDKIHNRLLEDNTRNKILKGELERGDCNNSKVYNFLKILKYPTN